MDLPPDVCGPMAQLRSLIGAEVLRCEPITALPGPRSPRGSFRISAADGRVFKLRRVATRDDVERITTLAGRLATAGVEPPLGSHDTVLLEVWIDGEPLDRAPATAAVLAACGRLLGSIHALGQEPRDDIGIVERKLARLAETVRDLVGAGALTPNDGQRVQAAARGSAPTVAAVAVTHGDFCAENLVKTPDGSVRSIDNEGLRIDALDYDLARLWYRWLLSAEAWGHVMSGYRPFRDPAPFAKHVVFWTACCLADAAHFRATAGTADATKPLRRLLAVIDHGDRGPLGDAS